MLSLTNRRKKTTDRSFVVTSIDALRHFDAGVGQRSDGARNIGVGVDDVQRCEQREAKALSAKIETKTKQNKPKRATSSRAARTTNDRRSASDNCLQASLVTPDAATRG